MLIIHQSDGDRVRGYNGPVSQADEIAIQIPTLAAGVPSAVGYDIPQKIPVGAVVTANVIDVLLVAGTVLAAVDNSVSGKLRVVWINAAGTPADVNTRLRYKLDSHAIPTNPQIPFNP